jgi:HAD superfamily hydrolase (TIGR01509 family)
VADGADSRRPAVLFDIDGTLVDSNYLHVHAWHRAFNDAGVTVASWRIHRAIGMDGATLVKSLATDVDDEVRQRAKDLHSRYYKDAAAQLRLLPGARELLHRVDAMGLQVVLATSAPEDELAILREVLDCDDVVSAVTSAEDVDTAKPQPDIIEVALGRAGIDAEHAAFVGDAVWDAVASARAGVPMIGLRSGGVSREELQDAGVQSVFDDALDLCGHVEGTVIGALTHVRAGSQVSG